MTNKHSHYHKDVSHLKSVDVYRVLELFGVTDQALGHAIKKLMCAGQRGAGKTFEQDVREAVDTLNRRLQMLAEDGSAAVKAASAPSLGILPTAPGPMQVCLACGELGGHFGLACPKAVPVAHLGGVPPAPGLVIPEELMRERPWEVGTRLRRTAPSSKWFTQGGEYEIVGLSTGSFWLIDDRGDRLSWTEEGVREQFARA